MRTKTITIRLDDETEKIMEDIVSNTQKRSYYPKITKAQVILAAIKEFSKIDIDTQYDNILKVFRHDGRRKQSRRGW